MTFFRSMRDWFETRSHRRRRRAGHRWRITRAMRDWFETRPYLPGRRAGHGRRLTRAMRAWFKTRPYRRLWRSMPALVAGLAWAGFGFALAGWTSADTRTRYSLVATRALAARDFQTARVACERLLLLGSDSRGQNLFQLALAKIGLGQEQEASALLNSAAPIEKPGYAPAHLLVARGLLAGTNLTAQVLRQAELHLNHALMLEPNSVEANEMLGRLYFQTRDWDSAKKHLLAVVSARPNTVLMLAALANAAGDDSGMRGWAERAVKYYRDKVEKAKTDSPADRLAWGQAVAMQGDYAEAIQILDAGRKRSGNQIYASALADLYASWADQVARQEPRNMGSRLRLVQQGLECELNNIRLLKLLLALSHLEGPEAKTARETLTNMLAEGGSSAMLHFILGSDAWQQGEKEQARKHFTLAFELAPDLPVVANNMALLLALGDPPDLPRALGIAQPLVEKFPDQPHFRDTRGQILVKLGRWDEAVKDLEFALPRLDDKGATHTALAQAYRNLGLRELAAEHERLAKEPSPRKPASRRQERAGPGAG